MVAGPSTVDDAASARCGSFSRIRNPARTAATETPAPGSAAAPPSQHAESKRRVAALRRYIAELPADLRQAFVLNQIHEMTVEEIACCLDIGRLAVYTMLEQGIIPAIRLGRRWIVTRHAFETWERNCGIATGLQL